MPGWKGLLSIATLAGSVVLSAPATADVPRFEVAPFGGYRIGGEFDLENDEGETLRSVDLDADFSVGLGLAMYRDPDAFYELLYSRQSTQLDDSDPGLSGVDLTTEYFHFGGTLIFDAQRRLRPYLSVTLGLTRFDADGFGSEYKFSGSLGLGVRVALGTRTSILLGARGYGTVVESDSEFVCSSVGGDAACLVRSSGDVFFQGEATVGIAVAF